MMRATVGEYVRCESGVDVASPGVMVDGREVDAVDTVSYTHLTLPTILLV